MNYTKFFFLVFTSFLLITACNKDDDNNPDTPDNPNPNDTIPELPDFDVPEIQDIIMYEVNLRAFSESGDLQGVISRLDELKALSVNVIWLMPVYPIGEINSVNSPYSVKNYKEVGAEYGTLDDLIELVDEAHSRDMAVMMDWVANHTAWDNPWIYENPEWYTQDGSGNIIHPPGTNWLDVADLNFDKQDMRQSMIEAMKFWVTEAGVDGFRCDYADGVPFEFWRQAIDTLENIPDRDLIMLAEGARDDHFDAGFDLNFGWEFYGKLKDVYNGQSASGLFSTHISDYSNIPEGKHKLRFTTNHDESAWDATPMTLFDGQAGATAASVVMTFMGGVPMIYTGQEVGTAQTVPFFSNDPVDWNNNQGMLEDYKDFMEVYSSSDPAKSNNFTGHFSSDDVVCFEKEQGGNKILIIANIRDESVSFAMPSVLQNSTCTDAISEDDVSLGTQINLSEFEYLILNR